MIIGPVDQDQNLFHIRQAMPESLINKIINTDWLSMPWTRPQLQAHWKRRKINNSAIPWIGEWNTAMNLLWAEIVNFLGDRGWAHETYPDTVFWLDEPDFRCGMHVDGGLIGAMQLFWIGDIDNGTCFYNTKNFDDLRYQFSFLSNQGYLTITVPTAENFTPLLWHAMPTPVKQNTFRITSYTRVTCPPQPAWTL